MFSKLFKGSLLALVLLPTVTLAQADGTAKGALTTVKDLLDLVIPIIMVLALIYFFYGLAKFIFNAGDEEARHAGRGIMIYGIIALFVMVAVWGLVGLIGKTFIGTDYTGDAPDVEDIIPDSN